MQLKLGPSCSYSFIYICFNIFIYELFVCVIVVNVVVVVVAVCVVVVVSCALFVVSCLCELLFGVKWLPIVVNC